MQYTTLGRTDITISRITHGCMELGGGPWEVMSDKENIALLHTALDNGITTFDTAESYGGGHSEEVVGQALRAVRDRVVLCTKVAKEHLHKNDVIAACEGSLRRLGIDCIDLLYIHWPNADIEIGETMEGFNTLKQQGKIRAIGVSNFSVPQLQEALRYARIDALQPEYNLLTRDIEAALLPFCLQNDISVLPYNSLAKGILSGAFHFFGATVMDFRTAKPLFQPEALAIELPLLQLLRDLAQTHSVSIAQVAIAACLAQPGIASAIVGTQNPRHFIDNIAATELTLAQDELCAIADASAAVISSL